jgi:hypothetical protein
MILDSQEQKDILIALVANMGFKGSDIDKIYSLKQSILTAEIKET